MSETDQPARDDPHGHAPASSIYDEDGTVLAHLVGEVVAVIESEDADALRQVAGSLHISETGDLIEALAPDLRPRFVLLLGDAFDFAALTEVDEAIRLDILATLPSERIVTAFSGLDSDDAVFILEDLDTAAREAILSRLPFTERIRLRRSLDYPEETAGRRMQTEFVAVPPFWTVGQTIDHMREDRTLPDSFSQIFVVDAGFHLVGAVDLDRILRSQRTSRIEEIMDETRYAIPATMDQEEAAQIFERYDLLSAAVVDENDRLAGVLTIDDVVDVIQQEAEEDLMRMGGVGDEELSDTVMAAARSRLPWLIVNLFTAFLAASVISLFDSTIEAFVALAVLMPIVAGMGGNAASQTMTIAVRALATRDLGIHNIRRIIRRELLVGLLNGVVLAVLVGGAAGLWFASPTIGCIIGIALVFNMITAALGGILVPTLLDRFNVDPAVASAVFVFTITDVVGFFAFLGLAAWWYGIW